MSTEKPPPERRHDNSDAGGPRDGDVPTGPAAEHDPVEVGSGSGVADDSGAVDRVGPTADRDLRGGGEPDGERAAADRPDVVDGADQGQSGRTAVSRGLLWLLFGVASTALLLDIVTKVAVVANLEGGPPLRLFGGLVYFDVLRNPGAAFSLATGMTWVLALLAIGFVVLIVWLAPKLRSPGWSIGLGLVLGGACGNLVDRLFRAPGPLQGHVVDFVSVLAPNGAFFPVFNIADSSIVCGGLVVIVLSLLGRDYDGTVQRGRGKRAED